MRRRIDTSGTPSAATAGIIVIEALMRFLAPVRSVRSVRRAASAARLVAILAAAAASAALPARAGAQADCPQGGWALYQAIGPEGCRVGEVVFGGFALTSFSMRLDRVRIYPLAASGGDAIGRIDGFVVEVDPAMSLSSAATPVGGTTDLMEGFQFDFVPLNVVEGSYGLVPLFMGGSGATSTTGWFATVIASVNEIYHERFSVGGFDRELCVRRNALADCADGTVTLPWDPGTTLMTSFGAAVRTVAPQVEGRGASATGWRYAVGIVDPTVAVVTTPEPATWALCAAGLLGVAAAGRRRPTGGA